MLVPMHLSARHPALETDIHSECVLTAYNYKLLNIQLDFK